MLLESELAVEMETQVPPVGLWAQRRSPCVGCKAQIDGRISLRPRSVEMEDLGLVVFKDEAEICEQFEQDTIRALQRPTVILQ